MDEVNKLTPAHTTKGCEMSDDMQHIQAMIDRATDINRRCIAANAEGDDDKFWAAAEEFLRLGQMINEAIARNLEQP